MRLPRRSLADGIHRVGFRKWYERELLSGHAHMLLAFLCVIALIASMEAFSGGTAAEKLTSLGFVLISAGVGLWALRRYLYLLMHAEAVANQANGPQCDTDGSMTLVQEDRRNGDALVCCRKCRHTWAIGFIKAEPGHEQSCGLFVSRLSVPNRLGAARRAQGIDAARRDGARG